MSSKILLETHPNENPHIEELRGSGRHGLTTKSSDGQDGPRNHVYIEGFVLRSLSAKG